MKVCKYRAISMIDSKAIFSPKCNLCRACLAACKNGAIKEKKIGNHELL